MTEVQFDQLMGLISILIAAQFYKKDYFLSVLWTAYGIFMFVMALLEVVKQ